MQGLSTIQNDLSEIRRDEIARLIQIKIDGSTGISVNNRVPKFLPWSVYSGIEVAERVKTYCACLGWTCAEVIKDNLWTITYLRAGTDIHYSYTSSNQIEAMCLAANEILKQ